jgi:hypothetical protein
VATRDGWRADAVETTELLLAFTEELAPPLLILGLDGIRPIEDVDELPRAMRH